MPIQPVRVLFVCTANSARSQIAQALLGRRLGSPEFEVTSDGTVPKGVNPLTIRTLAEVGSTGRPPRASRSAPSSGNRSTTK